METLTHLSRQYAQALAHLLEQADTNEEEVVENLIKHLRSRGRLKLLGGIVRELKKARMQERKKEPCVEIAREESRKAAQAAVEELGVSTYAVTLNPTLVRGWRVRAQGHLVDQTTKRALIELYRTIIR